MARINYQKEIKEEVLYLEKRLSTILIPKARNRCEVLIWLKSGRVTSMRQAIILKGMNKSQGSEWWKQYKSEGIDGFLTLKYKGQSSPLKDKTELKERLEKEGFSTINQARLWILKSYGLAYTENGLGNYFRRNKIKLKTGRPHHPEKDEVKRTAYKKNMSKS